MDATDREGHARGGRPGERPGVPSPHGSDAAKGGPQTATLRLAAWRRQHLGGLSPLGLLLAGVFLIAANTPSLLPRPWWLQGILMAIFALLGYVLGVLAAALLGGVRRWMGLEIIVDPVRARRLEWLIIGVLAAVVAAFPFLTLHWQRNVSLHVGLEPPGWTYPLGGLVVAVLVFAALITLWRLIEGFTEWIFRRVHSRILRESTAKAIAALGTAAVLFVVLTQVLTPLLTAVVFARAQTMNTTAPEGRTAPTSTLRTGGPGSLFPWRSLGQDGALFVSMGPSADDIAGATGRPAEQPIRVFVGLQDTLEQGRDGVLAEMDRTGAWERDAILVAIPTSTGYISDRAVGAFEYLENGDSATVSMAYSTLPSAFAVLLERERPARAARLLIEAVRERVDAMPPQDRPRVYVTGESLGAQGGDEAFTSPDEMLGMVDGGVLSGTPAFADNRRSLTEARAPGSTSVIPVIDDGRNFRYAANPDHLTADEFGRPLGKWSRPRIVYLQHATDPVVWWEPSLAYRTPIWLRETRAATPMAQMSWTFLVSFGQVTADLLVANSVPPGHGHRYYGSDMVPTWEAVLDVRLEPGERARLVAALDGHAPSDDSGPPGGAPTAGALPPAAR